MSTLTPFLSRREEVSELTAGDKSIGFRCKV
jgi:hypothetical protein